MTDKRYGRSCESPIIGAGTCANARCAVSGIGWGEFYIRVSAAHEICARMAYLEETPAQAGEAVINREIPALGGDGGAIVLSADGQVAMPFNTEGMARGWIGADGVRSEEHTSELQSLMRISTDVFCLKQKTHKKQKGTERTSTANNKT